LYLDKASNGKEALLSKKTDGVYIDTNGQVHLNETNLCLTLMQCESGGDPYCSPSPTQRIRFLPELKRGSYLKFQECDVNVTLAQKFEINPPCARNCTKEKLLNNVQIYR